jgi:hypothetical protein
MIDVGIDVDVVEIRRCHESVPKVCSVVEAIVYPNVAKKRLVTNSIIAVDVEIE